MAAKHILRESTAKFESYNYRDRQLLVAALSNIFHCDTLENRDYLRGPDLAQDYADLRSRLI